MSTPEPLVNIIVPPVFLLLFISFLYFLSKAVFRKYERLSELFPVPQGKTLPTRWISISTEFGFWESSNNATKFSADRDGFYLNIIWIFRFGKKPAFVPWNRVRLHTKRRYLFLNAVVFSFPDLPEIEMCIYGWDWFRAKRKFPAEIPQELRNIPGNFFC